MSCSRESHDAAVADALVWPTFAYVGVQDVVAGLDPVAEPAFRIELRNCPHCHSTLSRELPRRFEYARIVLTDGTRFILRVYQESERFITGTEVNAEGDEVIPAGATDRTRIVERSAIRKRTVMHMDKTYAMLVVTK